jgi:pilus assembly protein Flp/PilA
MEGMSGFTALRDMAARQFARFCADENGATAIEYGMIAAGVGATIAATVWSLGEGLKTTFYDKLAALFP